MSQDTWTALDSYIANHLIPADPVLDAVLAKSNEQGLPEIQVSAALGKFLHLIAQIHGAKRILEIGTLGGYSTIWLARALPAGGKIVTLEFEPLHARVAEENLAAAGFKETVEIMVGPALDNLPRLTGGEPFDLVFIDADKRNNPHYVEWALQLTRPGSLIIVDNVVRGGEVVNEASEDESILGTRAMFEKLAEERRLNATALQTVGSKGYDGFLLARVL